MYLSGNLFSSGELQLTKFIIHDDGCHPNIPFHFSILGMLWIILLLIILLLPAWIFLSPMEFKIDTRVPVIMLQWKSIGNATIIYEDKEWWLKVSVLFFSKKWDVVQMIFANRKKKKKAGKEHGKESGRKSMSFLKFFKILKTFQIVQLEIAYCAEDYTENAYRYWLNFFPLTREHVHINFIDKNYLVLIIRNKAWRMAYAFLK